MERLRLTVLSGLAWLVLTAQSPASLPFYGTYLGGTREDALRDIAVDGQGFIYVTGGTASTTDFPTTADAHDRTHNGNLDVFLTKYAPDGTLAYSTFLGGPNYDRAYAIELDSVGNVYLAGRAGAGFPTTSGVIQPSFGGDVAPNTFYGQQDGFIAKFSPAGALLWATYFGGDDLGIIRDIAVDGAGNVYLASAGNRANPHITPNAFQRTLRGSTDLVIAKISPDGRSIVYASYLGGSGSEAEQPSIRVDSQGFAYLLSTTDSLDLAVTPNAYQRALAGSTDWLVARIAQNGSNLVYLTYFGSSGEEITETHNLSIDGTGNVYITAQSLGTTLPTTPSAYQRTHRGNGGPGTGQGTNYAGDAYIAKLSDDGSRLLAATYLGGSVGDAIEGSSVDGVGNVYVTGGTFSSDFPVTTGAIQSSIRGGVDLFLAKLSSDLSTLLYSSYLGGTGGEVGRSLAIDTPGNVYAGGETGSSDFPTSANGQDRTYGGGSDGFLVRHPGILPTTVPAAPTNLRIIR